MEAQGPNACRIDVVGGRISDDEAAALTLVLRAKLSRAAAPAGGDHQIMPAWRRTRTTIWQRARES